MARNGNIIARKERIEMLNEYSGMLLNSAKEVNKIIKNPKYTNENKVVIAAANTLAQTAKTAIQITVLEYKKNRTYGNTTQLIEKIGNNEINSMEG